MDKNIAAEVIFAARHIWFDRKVETVLHKMDIVHMMNRFLPNRTDAQLGEVLVFWDMSDGSAIMEMLNQHFHAPELLDSFQNRKIALSDGVYHWPEKNAAVVDLGWIVTHENIDYPVDSFDIIVHQNYWTAIYMGVLANSFVGKINFTEMELDELHNYICNLARNAGFYVSLHEQEFAPLDTDKLRKMACVDSMKESGFWVAPQYRARFNQQVLDQMVDTIASILTVPQFSTMNKILFMDTSDLDELICEEEYLISPDEFEKAKKQFADGCQILPSFYWESTNCCVILMDILDEMTKDPEYVPSEYKDDLWHAIFSAIMNQNNYWIKGTDRVRLLRSPLPKGEAKLMAEIAATTIVSENTNKLFPM